MGQFATIDGGCGVAHAIEIGGANKSARCVNRHQFCGQKGMVTIVGNHNSVIFELFTQFNKKPCGVNAILTVVLQPFFDIGRFILLDRRLQFAIVGFGIPQFM